MIEFYLGFGFGFAVGMVIAIGSIVIYLRHKMKKMMNNFMPLM